MVLGFAMVIAAIIPDPIQELVDRITQGIQNLGASVQPLTDLIATTPLNLTIGNPIVMQVWQTMTVVADLFLGLFIVVGAIQMMYGLASDASWTICRQSHSNCASHSFKRIHWTNTPDTE